MRRRSTVLLCATVLLAGISIGAGFDSWRFSTPVQAKALDRSLVDRTYRELQAGRGSLFDGSQLLAKIVSVTTPSVVKIQSKHQTARRGMVEETGSGVIIKNSKVSGTFIVTNRHVIVGADKENIVIHLSDGRTILPSRIWTDKDTDLAVLRVKAKNLQPARLGDSSKVEIGHMVLAMGSPFNLSQSVTYGIISAKGRRSLRLPEQDVLNQDFLQTDAAINPGNSGGPLIDLHGRVIGINTAIASNSGGNDGIGFSIPSNLVRYVVNELLLHGKVQRAYLGVKLDSAFTSRVAARLKLDRARGARVVEVYPNTPASRAKLKFDDVILNFNGVDVMDENHLINLVSLTPIGKKPMSVVIFRGGRRITIQVVLGDRSELEQRSQRSSGPDMGVPFAPMGLTLHRMDHNIAQQLGFDKREAGLLVLKVDSTGPLFEDVRLYDLIVEVARTPVRSIDDLYRVLRDNAADDSVVLKIRRRENGRPDNHLVIWRR